MGDEPAEDEGHDESRHDDGHNYDEGEVEEEFRDEAAGGDLVDVAGMVAVDEAGDGGDEIRLIVEDSRRILSSAGVLLREDESDGGIDGIVGEGRRVGEHVRIHVEDVSTDDEDVGKNRDLTPIEADLLRRVDDTEGAEESGSRGLEGAGRGSGGGAEIRRCVASGDSSTIW